MKYEPALKQLVSDPSRRAFILRSIAEGREQLCEYPSPEVWQLAKAPFKNGGSGGSGIKYPDGACTILSDLEFSLLRQLRFGVSDPTKYPSGIPWIASRLKISNEDVVPLWKSVLKKLRGTNLPVIIDPSDAGHDPTWLVKFMTQHCQ